MSSKTMSGRRFALPPRPSENATFPPRIHAVRFLVDNVLSPRVYMLEGYPWQGNVREQRAFPANLSTLAGPRPLIPSLVSRAFRSWTRITTRGEDR